MDINDINDIKYDEKDEKYIIIDLYGIKYKAIHRQASSINNKFFIYLAQVKYFIKTICINSKQISFKVWDAMLTYLETNYPFCIDIISILCTFYVILGGLFTIASIIKEIIELIKLVSISYSYFTICKKSFVIIIEYILSYAFLLIFVSIITIVVIYILCRIFTIIALLCVYIFNILNQIIVSIFNKFNRFYEKIPELEPINTIEMI